MVKGKYSNIYSYIHGDANSELDKLIKEKRSKIF
jgi:hypothetical protein